MRRFISFALLACIATAHADLAYTVLVQPETTNLHVKLRIPKTDQGVQIQIPNWGPGSYRLVDNYLKVKNLKATDELGNVLKVEQSIVQLPKAYQDGADMKTVQNNLCTWTISPAKTTVVEYDMAQPLLDGSVHWSGPATYIYPVGRTQEKCTLEIGLPSGWQAYLGLNTKKGQPSLYEANTYDVLADNPVSTGELTVDTYEAAGKTHYIVMRGKARSLVDRAYLIKACKFVSDMETDLMGGAPYDHYVWHFSVNEAADGAGGLEHLSSTEISLASGLGPRAVSVLSHEFFHLWNVKRIRSFPLGPFDYTKLPQTGALWWLEGVTDYYAHMLLYRYGWWTQDAYFKDIVSNMNSVRGNTAHTEIGPNESSRRVDEASGGKGNSNGYRISYYNQGWLVGMILDIEMRAHTQGKRSLDDVLHALWKECKDDRPGFQEDEIRKLLVKFGGNDIGTVYDNVVMKGGEMPIEEALAKVGLRITEKDEQFVDIGFTPFADTDGARPTQQRGEAVSKFQGGDLITAIDGKSIAGTRREMTAALNAMIAGAKVGTPIKLTVKRGTGSAEVEIIPVAGTRKSRTVEADPSASSDTKVTAASWLAQKKM